MSTELYYFSGTGNSLFVAKELQKRIPDASLLPIASLLNHKSIRTSANTIGIIFPVHALTIPIAVKRFIEKTDFESADYLFAIATRVGSVFRGFEKMNRILRRKKRRLSSHFILNMGSNESRHEDYKIPSEKEIRDLEINVVERLDSIQSIIQGRTICLEQDLNYTIPCSKNPIAAYMLEKLVLVSIGLSEYIGGVNYFYSDSKCNGCGICEKVCLSRKIKMNEKRPIWQKKSLCYMCFACLNYCPMQAVQIKDIPGVKSSTQTNGRYPHPYATVNDIASQKDNRAKT